MSTPSTATATLPPHAHQYYSHHQSYQPPVSGYHVNTQFVNGTSRLSNSHNSNSYQSSSSDNRQPATVNLRQIQQPAHATLPPLTPTISSSQQHTPGMTSDSQNRQRERDRKAGPDWQEYFKNGLPKEVIVIEDTPEPPHMAQQASRAAPPVTNGVSGSGSTRHADKKRKTTNSTVYDPVYNQQHTYSATQTPYYEHSSSHNTVSTDRTTSALNTTAATSLGSQASNGVYLPPLEEGIVGQKRKRTRKATIDEANEAKRREVLSPFSNYMPPPNPPIKAGEVKVQVINEEPYSRDQKCDDDDGHYVVVEKTDLTRRYEIQRLLGQGTFGKVVEAYDRKKKTRCAIKVIRSVQKYRDASRIELRVLSTLASNDKTNRNKCIHLRDCFDFRNHICIVTDLYGQSVFDFLKSNQFVPFPSTHIQNFAKQLFISVAFLHDLSLIHTDLKPENILLVNNAYQTFTYNRNIPSSSTSTTRSARHRKVLLDPDIRLIDFGSATFNEEYHSSVVSTRHYRAPEIILNLGWSFPCDIWSIGCILVEFFTGDALFQTHDNLEHLAMMEAVCGTKFDKEIVRDVFRQERGQSKNPATAYFKNSKLDYPNNDTPKASRKYVKAMKKLQDIIPQQPQGYPNEFNKQFLDLLKKIFVYNPAKRITAKQALKHPWFKQTLEDDGTEALKIRKSKEEKARQESERRRSSGTYHGR